MPHKPLPNRMTADLCFLSVQEVRRLLSSGHLSAREYVAALLDALEQGNDQFSAFLEFYPEEALAAAAQCDDNRARGRIAGTLAGIPFGVKDLIDVQGKRTTAQSRAFASTIAATDAAVVGRMRDAGAILIGKLSLEECGIGSPMDELPWPPARNPWDHARSPGGSSTGCGVALAAGFVPLAIGTDTGGSVRNPAALCGVVGLKPTHNRINRRGVLALAPTLDHVGLMARRAADCALLLECLDPKRFATHSLPHSRPLAGYKIGSLRHLYEDQKNTDEQTRGAINAACTVLEALGAQICDVHLPKYVELCRISQTILYFEAYRQHRSRLLATPAHYGERCRCALEIGAAIAPPIYDEARSIRERLSEGVEGLLRSCDALITAAVCGPACRLDDETALLRSGQGLLRIPFNLSGHPALSVCVGFSDEGLPLAMQLVGRKFQDETVLAIAAAYEEATTWHLRRPPLGVQANRTYQL
jgi:aspartyl-tRNA(Asn)/glutamyl-tRNA(Gln) amidotransferase subunit A